MSNIGHKCYEFLYDPMTTFPKCPTLTTALSASWGWHIDYANIPRRCVILWHYGCDILIYNYNTGYMFVILIYGCSSLYLFFTRSALTRWTGCWATVIYTWLYFYASFVLRSPWHSGRANMLQILGLYHTIFIVYIIMAVFAHWPLKRARQ